MYRGSTPRRPETWVSLCNLMLKLHGIWRSSAILGSDSPQSNNKKDNTLWVTPFIPREIPYIKHAIASTAYTSACTDARAALASQLSGRTRVPQVDLYWLNIQSVSVRLANIKPALGHGQLYASVTHGIPACCVAAIISSIFWPPGVPSRPM